MQQLIMSAVFLLLTGCAARKTAGKHNSSYGDTRTKQVVMLDKNAYLLTETTEDKTYAFNKSNPVKVGDRSPANEKRYLNGLQGPNGEEILYYRAGSCCPFKTPNGLIDNTGMLDRYKVYWEGCTDTLDIYINMYDKGDLKIPVGLQARKP